jgi:hypothetical protein
LKYDCTSDPEGRKSLTEDQQALGGVFPNPTSGNITLSLEKESESLENAHVEILDQSGKLVMRIERIQPINHFDLQFLSKGIYFVKVYLKDEALSWTFIKQ